MWYAISMNDGIIHEEKTKRDILNKGYKTIKKHDRGDYEIIGSCNDQEYSSTIYLYDSKNKAIENGFEWAFKINERK